MPSVHGKDSRRRAHIAAFDVFPHAAPARRSARPRRFFPDTMDYYVHEVEGALFLWLWFKDLPITSMQLYERLKKRRVLVVPGEFFFFGLPEDEPGTRPIEPWAHRHECLRVSFAMDATTVREGLRLIAEEAARAYGA